MAAGEAALLFVRVGADISGFQKGMAAAQAQMNGVASRMQGMGTRMAATGVKMTKFISLPIAAGFGMAIKAAAGFEQELNIMQATSSATGAQMGKVSKLAKALGADIKIPGASAADAAQAMTALAKGGLSVEQSMAAARGTLQLAAAAEIGNAEAATITADALNAFALKGKDAGRVADLLAASANASTAEIGDMALGLSQSSAVAKMFGVKIEDTVTALARLANAGIKGSDAGTSLKTMFMRLGAPIGSGAKAIAKFNIELRDQNGQLKTLPALADEFTRKLGNLVPAQRDAAMAAIFGSDALRAGNILLMQGADAHEKMREKVMRQGAAADFAAARMKGFKGSVEAFKSSAETAAISLGEILLPAATRTMGGITGLVGAVDGLPRPVKEAGAAILGVAAVTGPALFGIGKLTQFIGRLKDGSSALGAGLMALRSPWGLAAAGAGLLGYAIFKILNPSKRVNVFAREMAGAFRATADASRDAAAGIDRQRDALLRLQGINLDVRDSAFRLRDAKKALADALREGGKSSDAYKRQLIEVQRIELEQKRTTEDRNRTLREGILDIKGTSDALKKQADSAAKARDMAQRQTFAVRAGIATGTEAARISKDFTRAQSTLSTTLKDVAEKHRDSAARARDMAAGITDADSASQTFKRNYEKLAKLEAIKAGIAEAFRAIADAAGAALGNVNALYDRLSKPPPAPKLPSLNPFGKGAHEMARADPIQQILDGLKSKDEAIRKAAESAAETMKRTLTNAISARVGALKATFGNIAASAMKAFQDQTAIGVDKIRSKFGEKFSALDAEVRAAGRQLADRFKGLRKGVTDTQAEMTPAEAEIARLEGGRDAARLIQSIADAERDLAKAQTEGDPERILAAQRSLADARLEQSLAALRVQAEEERKAKDATAQASLDALDRQQEDEQLSQDEHFAGRRTAIETQMNDEIRIYETGREIQQRQLETHLNAMEAKLERGKGIAGKAAAGIVALLNSYGIDFKTSGKRLGKDFTDGLKHSIGAVDSVATQIANKVADKLRLHSPAKKGPLASLDTWFTGFAPTLLGGLDMGAMDGAMSGVASAALPGRGRGGGGGDTYTFNFPNYVGDKREMAEAVRSELLRAGRRMPGVLGGLA